MASVGSSPRPELLMAVRNEHNKPSVFRHLLVIRLLNAWWVLTFFQPDEYFQALEPAWRMAFGEGSGAWITWVSFSFSPLVSLFLSRSVGC